MGCAAITSYASFFLFFVAQFRFKHNSSPNGQIKIVCNCWEIKKGSMLLQTSTAHTVDLFLEKGEDRGFVLGERGKKEIKVAANRFPARVTHTRANARIHSAS